MFRKRKDSDETDSRCHFAYYYIIVAMSIAGIVCGMSNMSNLLLSASEKSSPQWRTSLKLSTPNSPVSRNGTMELSFAVVSKPRHSKNILPQNVNHISVSKFGSFTKSPQGAYSLSWGNAYHLSSDLNIRGFGMILGELIAFCGKLYTADQATGIIYEVATGSGDIFPRHVVMGGDGMNSNSLQSEWATVKSGVLYIGACGLSMQQVPWGAESVSSRSLSLETHGSQKKRQGDRVAHPIARLDSAVKKALRSASNKRRPPRKLTASASQWIAVIDPSGRVNHLDWSREYSALETAAHLDVAASVGVAKIGLCHEAVLWSDNLNVWIFLPTVVEMASGVDSQLGSGSGKRNPHYKSPRQQPDREDAPTKGMEEEVPTVSRRVGDVLLMQSAPDFSAVDVVSVDVSAILQSAAPDVVRSKENLNFQFSSARFLPDSGDKVIVAILTIQSADNLSGAVDRGPSSYLVFLGLDGRAMRPGIPIPDSETRVFSGLEFL